MRFYQYVSLSFLLIFVYTIYSAEAQKDKHVIIFDLTNVLIKENQVGFAKKIGYGTLASYALTHWKNPGYRCLDMLAAMSTHETQKPHITVTLNNRVMPRCIVELQEGKKTCAETKSEIMQSIEDLNANKFFGSAKEKTLMTNIMNLVLDPETVAIMIEPMKPTVQLIQKLKAAGHQVNLCGNAPGELYAAAKKKLPDIINLFDGIVISSHIKTVKPDPTIFNHLTTTHNLNPANCIVIDALEETAAAARTLGMQAIVFNKIAQVAKELKKCGVKI